MAVVSLTKIFVLLFFVSIYTSCSSVQKFQTKKDNEYQIYRIKNENHVDIDLLWLPLRDTIGDIITDSLKANIYRDIYSYDSLGNRLFNKSISKLSFNQNKPKEALSQYLHGYQSLLSKDYAEAKKHFNNAIQMDSSIIYDSDIYKLLGQTFSNQDSIVYYDSIYHTKSSQLVPLGFLSNPLNFNLDASTLRLSGTDYINNHYLKEYTQVPYSTRYNYAYLRNQIAPYNIGLGVIYSQEGASLEIDFSQKFTKNNRYTIQYLSSPFTNGFNFVLEQQTYQNIHNQINHTIGLSFNAHKFEIFDDKEINYYDLSLISQLSYSLSDEIQIHNFGQIFYYNEFNHMNSSEYELWRNSTFNLGITNYLIDQLGVQAQLLLSTKGKKSNFNADLSLGICLAGIEIAYRIIDETLNMQLVSVPFFMNKFTSIVK